MSRPFSLVLFLSCAVFGATQSSLLGMLPYLSLNLSVPLSQVISVFAIGTFFYLLATLYWGQRLQNVSVLKVIVFALVGLLASQALIAGTLIYRPAGGLYYFAFSRVIFALCASAIIPLSLSLRFTEKNESAAPLLSHALALMIGRCVGLLFGLLTGLHLERVLVFIAVVALATLAYAFPLSRKSTLKTTNTTAFHKIAIDFTLVLPLLFCLVTSFFHTGLTAFAKSQWSEVQMSSRFLYQTLLALTFSVSILQILLRHRQLIDRVGVSLIGLMGLFGAGVFFELLGKGVSAIPFIACLAFALAILPSKYNQMIARYLPAQSKLQIASTVNASQILGNVFGASLMAYFLSKELSAQYFTLASICLFATLFLLAKASFRSPINEA